MIGPMDTRLVSATELEALRTRVLLMQKVYMRDLERLVNIDCGSYTKAGVDAVGSWTADYLHEQLGAEVTIDPNQELGDTVVGVINGPGEGPTVLMIGHLDTVFDPGTAAERPFRVEDGLAYGPGVSDMKGGLLAGLYALKALMADSEPGEPWLPVGRVVFIANPDEEIGSPVSTPVIRSWASASDLALVLECARANGDIVSSRKGTVDLELRIRGRASHAGVEPEKGRSAILEASHKIIALHALTGVWPGTTVNVGVVQAGTRPNVVAAEALLRVDLRSITRAGMEHLETSLQEIADASVVPDVTCEVTEMARHWPMEKLERSERLVAHAKEIADSMGFPLKDTGTGGASDANTTAGMDVPSLDGLGPIGGNDHAPGEYLEVNSIVPRTTLLAGLILAAGRDAQVAEWRTERLTRVRATA
jgi:glutamate carboxypeptidase